MTRLVAVSIVLAGALALGCSSGNDIDGEAGSTITSPPLDRLIEEGDIVWLDDPTLYVLNRTNGLSVVGLGNPAAPLLIGRVPLQGMPVELYLHNGYILALTSGIFNSSSATSTLTLIDVRRPEKPIAVSRVELYGGATNSRLVGDVLYVVSDSGRVIESVDVVNPAAPRLVDRLLLPLGNSGSHVLATQNVLYVATESFQASHGMGECAERSSDREGCTIILAVDISSLSGAIRVGATYAMAGLLKDRWGLDAYEGVLRVLVARGGWWTSSGSMTARLRTFRSTSAAELDPLASLSLDTVLPEKVMAVRFDGPRAYVVTYRQIDPLFTIDVADPAHPRIAGELQTPGWLDFIIPRGDRLLGVGRDQDTQSGAWHLQASLYDVSAIATPRLMKRLLFGDAYSTLPDQADNLAKVVRVVDALGLLLVPYHATAVGYSAAAEDGRLEVISLADDTLTAYGRVASKDAIIRAVPLPPNHIAAVTEPAVGVIQLKPELAVTGVVDLNQPFFPQAGKSVDGGSHD